MKTSSKYSNGLVLALALILSASSAQAQLAAVAENVFAARHIVKTNLVGYYFYSLTANYEYKTGQSTSIGLLGGYKLPQVIEVNAIADAVEGGRQTYTGEIDPRGWFVNPYFRFYAQQSMSGFYFEGFLRGYVFTYEVPYDYDKNNQIIRANADGEASAFGGGLGFGYQFNLAQRFFLDVNVGLGLAKGNIHIETNDPNLDAADYAEIAQTIEDNSDADVQIFLLSDILSEIEAGADATHAWADINDVTLPIARAGISIGYAF